MVITGHLWPSVRPKSCTGQSAGSEVFDYKGDILEARVGIEPTNKGVADLNIRTVVLWSSLPGGVPPWAMPHSWRHSSSAPSRQPAQGAFARASANHRQADPALQYRHHRRRHMQRHAEAAVHHGL